jgi:hypothetical protein
MSSSEGVMRSLVPVALASIFFGVLSGRQWLRTVGKALIPPVLLGAFMVLGFAEHGEFIHGPPLAFLAGVILSVVTLGWVGSTISRLIA